MLRTGLISFALCAALFFAVSNCATISEETQAKLRDVQALNLEENGGITLSNDIEQRKGM